MKAIRPSSTHPNHTDAKKPDQATSATPPASTPARAAQPLPAPPKDATAVVSAMRHRMHDAPPDDTNLLPAHPPPPPRPPTMLTEQDLRAWLNAPQHDDRITQLQLLIAYVLDLAAATPAIVHSLRRVLTESRHDLLHLLDLDRVLRYCYCSCFKALVHLELQGIPFDIALVLEIVRWKTAFQTIAYMCSDFLVYQAGAESTELHELCSNNPKIIDHDAAAILLADLKSIASQQGDWKTNFHPRSDKLYGPKLQNSPTIALAETVAARGNANWRHLDTRLKNGPADDAQETITLIMAYVSAVDKVLGVCRDPTEWTSLREFLTLYRCCDEDGDLIYRRSILWRCESYGVLTPSFEDVLTPIAFETVFMDCSPFFEPYQAPENKVASIEHIDPYTLKLTRPDGTEEFLAFMCDVRYAQLTQNVACVMTKGKQISINFQRICNIARGDNDRLHNITMAIKEKVLGDTVVEPPYPSPQGIGIVAHALLRPWGAWRGVDIVNGAVAIASFTALQEAIEGLKSFRGERTTTCWDGMEVDAEVIALSRAIPERPSSFIVMAYLAHLCTASLFDWDHVSACGRISIGGADTMPLFDEADRRKFIDFETQKCRDLMQWSGPVSEQNEYLVVNVGYPVRMIIVGLALFFICAVPEAFALGLRWDQRVFQVFRNLGAIFVPIFALFIYVFYRDQDIRNVMGGQLVCKNLQTASEVTKRSREEIATCVKNSGLAELVFKTVGNSVSLSGMDGSGWTSSPGGLSARRLMDAGAIFLSTGNDENLCGMIDGGGFLQLSLGGTSGLWMAEAEEMELGVWRVLSRKELRGVRIA